MNYYRVERSRVVTTVAFLIGAKFEHFNVHNKEGNELISRLENNDNARLIRALNNIRSNLMLNYKVVENVLVYELKNLDQIELFDEDLQILNSLNVSIIKANIRVNDYIALVNGLINIYINKVKDLFPEWINWQYVKELFEMPKGQIEREIIKESTKYCRFKNYYPYQRYIYWDPVDQGNILFHDKKFITLLYSQHGAEFDDDSKVYDASESTKTNIYEFIDQSRSVVIVVDCENSDAYKLASVLKQLNETEISTIKKIVLYDDVHTTKAWSFLEGLTSIPVEHNLVERINENKSLVDIKMGMGISSAFFKDQVDSFILFSSDSDFWGVISSLPDARFLVMVESKKCGFCIKDALERNGTDYCYVDDFCTGNINDFKKAVLKSELNDRMKEAISLNSHELLNNLYLTCRIDASDDEKKNFYDRYIKKMRLLIDDNGDFYINVED